MISLSNLRRRLRSNQLLVDRALGYYKDETYGSSSIVVAAKAPCARRLATARITPSRSRPVAASTFRRMKAL